MVVVEFVIPLLVLSSILYLVVLRYPAITQRPIASKDKINVLFVTAHPDDECMFFTPTFYALSKQPNVDITVLCLSTGDHDGAGEVRAKELVQAASVLGVDPNKVIIVNSPDLPDNPKKVWNPALVAKTVKAVVVSGKVDAVFTFDVQGVSGHENHSSAYVGTKHMFLTDQYFKVNDVRLYTLHSTNLVRKYIGVLDTLFSLGQAMAAKDSLIFVSGLEGYQMGLRAMSQHSSQMVWFRRLYLAFSRYMFINTYSKVH
ncbi:N-acetylglucosaminyl-phosphatidylinositol de-N-acetylase [Mycoemilia scoparia]|uniref:N-acetylglucosaminylphosphatidylinositol deacetylase n=1 Tax=Mycoemilia scoparia TaxID=417184 RepID=A0A9W8AAN8_9FUNG|nr:N-acetylglucosaminyl-phosphatidylinositol de-N-acetylase [Mycoemilia scoparia]